MSFDPSYYGLSSVPQYYPYEPSPNYVTRLPVPPPPNAVQYPRITLRAADWSASRQCFSGECRMVVKIEGSNLPDYECTAVFTITYVPVNGWFPSLETSCRGPVLIYSSDMRVVWDATRDYPIVEAKMTIGTYWNVSQVGVEAHGPCELLVTPIEGTDLASYGLVALYTLKCVPLGMWKEVHEVVAENGSDFHEQESSVEDCRESKKSGRQNDVKHIPAYEGRVHNANSVLKRQGRLVIASTDLSTDPDTDFRLEIGKTSTLQQNKATKQDSHDAEDLGSQETPTSVVSKPQEQKEKENHKKSPFDDLSTMLSNLHLLLAGDRVPVATAEYKLPQDTETISNQKEKSNEPQLSDGVESSDDYESSEWYSDEEDEDYDKPQDTKTNSTEIVKATELQGSSDEEGSGEDEWSEWETLE